MKVGKVSRLQANSDLITIIYGKFTRTLTSIQAIENLSKCASFVVRFVYPIESIT